MTTTIIININEKRTEDNILSLVDLFKEEFSDQILRVNPALVIETDIPAVTAMFKAIAAGGEQVVPKNGNGAHLCPDCGAPTARKGKRCRSCGMKARYAREKLRESEEAEEL